MTRATVSRFYEAASWFAAARPWERIHRRKLTDGETAYRLYEGDGGALRVHRLTGHRARLRDERRLAGGEAGEEGGCPHGQQCGVRAEI